MTVRVLVVLVVLLPSILARQLIDGGENAASGRWKYFVSSWTSTQAPENDDAACGGVLVAEDVVLTAASCLTQWGDEVKVSAWRLTSNTAGGAQILSIESVFYQHPEYRNTIDGGTIALDYGYDFMLFRIEPSGIDPIPLNFIADNPETGELGWIMGFGDANVGDDVFSTQLRQVQVDVTTEAICNTAANYDGEVDGDLQICAGTTSGEGAYVLRQDDNGCLCHMAAHPLFCCLRCLNDEGGPLVGENGLLLGIFSTVRRSRPRHSYVHRYSRLPYWCRSTRAARAHPVSMPALPQAILGSVVKRVSSHASNHPFATRSNRQPNAATGP